VNCKAYGAPLYGTALKTYWLSSHEKEVTKCGQPGKKGLNNWILRLFYFTVMVAIHAVYVELYG